MLFIRTTGLSITTNSLLGLVEDLHITVLPLVQYIMKVSQNGEWSSNIRQNFSAFSNLPRTIFAMILINDEQYTDE